MTPTFLLQNPIALLRVAASYPDNLSTERFGYQLFTSPKFGVDRILFSVDYPYSPNKAVKTFLDEMNIRTEDKEKIAHGNAEKLLKLSA